MLTSILFIFAGRLLWVYLTGSIFLTAGVCALIDWHTRIAATIVGFVIVVFDLLTWAPRFLTNPGELPGNWLKDLGIAGGCVILGAAMSREDCVRQAKPRSSRCDAVVSEQELRSVISRPTAQEIVRGFSRHSGSIPFSALLPEMVCMAATIRKWLGAGAGAPWHGDKAQTS
jgi:hypothetical protein